MILQQTINIIDDFRPISGDTKLRSCIGDTFSVSKTLSFEELYLPTADVNFIYEPTPFESGTTLNSGLIICDDDQIFKNLLKGDTLGFYDGGFHSTHLITEKISNSQIRIASVVLTFGTGWYFYNATPIGAVGYKYSLNNGSNYTSLIDLKNNYRKCKNNNVWTNELDVSNKYGQIIFTGPSIADEVQYLAVVNTHVISPLFLSSQYVSLINGDKPPYFLGKECIKYTYEIEFFRNITDSIPIDSKKFTIDSSTGWFGEKFNGGITNYSLSNINIPASGRLQLDTPTTFTFDVDNTTDNPFTALSKLTFCICYLPETEDLYLNTKSLVENFIFEKANGGDLIDTYSHVRISASKLRCTVTIDPSTAAKLKLNEGSFKRYMMWCIVEDETRAINDRDKTALLIQVNEFEEHLTSTNLISFNTRIARHYEDLPADGDSAIIEAFTADDLVCKMNFNIDFTGKTTSGILINAIKPKIVLRKTGQAEIILEDNSFNTASFPVVGLAQIIDIEQAKPYKIADSLRKLIKIKREYALDTGNIVNWSLNYPIFLRWETWRQLLTSTIPSDLFDPALPNNGINHLWERLENIAGYDVYFEVEFQLVENGVNYSQIGYSNKILIYDFEEGTDFDTTEIKAYDSSNNLLVNGADSLLLGYEDVTIEASFNLIAGIGSATTSDFEIVLLIEIFQGGVTDVRQCSSVYDTDSSSFFKSIRVIKSIVGNKLVGTAVLDHTKLPKVDKFTIYARCYDISLSTSPFGKEFMNGDGFEFMNGSQYKFMDQ